MTFADIYNEQLTLEGRKPVEWLERMADVAAVSVNSVYLYALGWRNPHAGAAKLLSIELGIPAEELFPLSMGKRRLSEETPINNQNT